MPSGLILPLIPAGLIGLACLGVPGAALLALLWLSLGTALLDRFLPPDAMRAPPPDAVPVALAILHFGLLFAAVWAMALPGQPTRDLALFFATGLWIGQVSNSAAHELIHSSQAIWRWLGQGVYSSLLFGHHASAHVLVHHKYVATDQDPNSARAGQSVYRFVPRAWIGSFRAGLVAERARAAGFPGRWTPYPFYILGGLLSLALSASIAGPKGAMLHAALAIYATVQLLATDYVQHYGLRREQIGGEPEPVGPQHSWNAHQAASGRLMLFAAQHSAHHAGQDTGPSVPTLPASLPAMVTLAFFPRTFRRIMTPRLNAWREKQSARTASA